MQTEIIFLPTQYNNNAKFEFNQSFDFWTQDCCKNVKQSKILKFTERQIFNVLFALEGNPITYTPLVNIRFSPQKLLSSILVECLNTFLRAVFYLKYITLKWKRPKLLFFKHGSYFPVSQAVYSS